MIPQQEKDRIKREFAKFYNKEGLGDLYTYECSEEIADYFINLMEEREREVVEGIKKLEKDHERIIHIGNVRGIFEKTEYNNALNDVLALLSPSNTLEK